MIYTIKSIIRIPTNWLPLTFNGIPMQFSNKSTLLKGY